MDIIKHHRSIIVFIFSLIAPTFAVILSILAIIDRRQKKPLLMYKVVSDSQRNKKSGSDPKILFWNQSLANISIIDYEIIVESKEGNKSFRLTAESYNTNFKAVDKDRPPIHIPIVLRPGDGIGMYFPFNKARYSNLETEEEIMLDKYLLAEAMLKTFGLTNLYIKVYSTHKLIGFNINLNDVEVQRIK